MNDEHVDIFLQHLAGERGFSEHTVSAYRNDLSGLIDFLVESDTAAYSRGVDIAWDKIDEDDVARFVSHLESREYSPATRARKIASLRSFMRFLRDEGAIIDIPTRNLKAPRGGRPLPKSLSVADVERLLEQLHDATDPAALRDRAMVELMYAAGLRVSETTALDLKHVNFEACTVRCMGKGSKERVIPIYDAALEAVADYTVLGRPQLGRIQDPVALFLNRRGQRITRQGFWLNLNKMAQQAGIDKKITPHMLRHSFATHMLHGGASIRHIQELMGHESVATTQIYTHLTTERVRDEYDAAHPRAS